LADCNSYKQFQPERYNEILDLRKQGKSYNEITALTGAAPNTISRICHENAEELGKWKKRISNKLGEAIDLLSDRLITEGDKLAVGQIPVALAIAVDKKASLDGEAVSHVVHHKALTAESLEEKLKSLRSANAPQKDGTQVIDVQSDKPVLESN